MPSDKRFMLQALALARKGLRSVSPNPMVGALVVKNSEIFGSGWHKMAGEPHAEVYALREAGSEAKGATLYVTLEPCAHQGRTPPCSEAILKHGISRVVFASADPNPKAAGGMAMLEQNGVQVESGLCSEIEQKLNAPWRHHLRSKRPLVTLKLALSLDNRLSAGPGIQTSISCKESQRYVQKLRAATAAIMVGAETCRVDDPLLTNRSGSSHQPLRLTVSRKLNLPLESRMLSSNAAVACAMGLPESKKQLFLDKGVQLIELPQRGEGLDLISLLSTLGEDGVDSLLVEGGADLAKGLLESALVDRLLIFRSSDTLGGQGACYDQFLIQAGLGIVSDQRSGSDQLLSYGKKQQGSIV